MTVRGALIGLACAQVVVDVGVEDLGVDAGVAGDGAAARRAEARRCRSISRTAEEFVALGTTSALPLSPKHASLVESARAHHRRPRRSPGTSAAQSWIADDRDIRPAQRVRVGPHARSVPQPVTIARRARHGGLPARARDGHDRLDLRTVKVESAVERQDGRVVAEARGVVVVVERDGRRPGARKPLLGLSVAVPDDDVEGAGRDRLARGAERVVEDAVRRGDDVRGRLRTDPPHHRPGHAGRWCRT